MNVGFNGSSCICQRAEVQNVLGLSGKLLVMQGFRVVSVRNC